MAGQQTPLRERSRGAEALYDRLEDRILARDQRGASQAYYDLLKAGRPMPEIVAEAVRIHAPYTHVPYHERIDQGYPNFVNNDHCLLSARAGLNLARLMPEGLAALPMAQTIWYIPTGLDIWNQKISKAPGHYTRGFTGKIENPPPPAVYWPDQQAEPSSGPLQERLDHWMNLVHRGEVIPAYRHFLGLMQDTENRNSVLAELVFAGLIDVQDRMLYNRSYTTGHKSYRARATVELGNYVGWENAHDIVYAGALDIAVGPRWYSTYEMACNAVKMFIDGEALHAVPYAGASERERELLGNTRALTQAEANELIDVVIRQPEPAYVQHLAQLLLAGASPRRIIDVLQVAAAQIVLETQGDANFSMPQHCYEYCNTLGWFYDNFEHPNRLKLLWVAASFLNRDAFHQRLTGDSNPVRISKPAKADSLSAGQLLDRVEHSVGELNGPEALGWTQAYLDSGADRSPLGRRLALAATRIGNDPHNQEIAQCMVEDFFKTTSPDSDKLLLAAAQHTAVHRKYGDRFECSRRFGEAFDIARLQ